jgi:ABC-type branched-subunit amino acid transport system ATPase component
MPSTISNIFLIGPMGAGKTTIGAAWRRRCGGSSSTATMKSNNAPGPVSRSFLNWRAKLDFAAGKKP